jgi:hypothetical protein
VIVRAISLFVLGSLVGCEGEVGPCVSDTESRRVVYDAFGAPAFEGQALMITSCGYGAFCHSPEIDDERRFGAPVGLEYDVRLAGYDGTIDRAELDRMTEMRTRVYEHRRSIWAQVASANMPIDGAVGELVGESAPVYYRELPDTPMATLDTEDGREVLRNWLACGAPVVERTAPVDDPSYEPTGWIVDPIEVEPLEANWNNIYTRLIEPRCNGGPCHGASEAGELNLEGDAEALAALLNVASDGEECGETGARLIVPGDPDASLFVHKLSGRDAAGEPVCGRLMPIGASRLSEPSLQAVRDWIAGGATM